MKRGTKSLLFGVHAIWIHGPLVVLAWRKLFGTWPGFSDFLACMLHDAGYFGLDSIDSFAGKLHPVRTARWMAGLFGPRFEREVLGHSGSLAAELERPRTALYYADKFSVLLEFSWFYLFRAWLSGELHEFWENARHFEGLPATAGYVEWFDKYRHYVMNMFKSFVLLPCSKGFFTVVDADAPLEILSVKWSICEKTPGRPYAYRAVPGSKKRHQYLAAVVVGKPLGTAEEIDHINGDTLDNRRNNLRTCLHSENGRNLRKWTTPTSSRFKGVCHRSNGKWQAYINLSGRQKYLGLFDAEIDAAKAYNVAAQNCFGVYARLNEI